MQTCEPIMVLAEDIEVIDAIIKNRHNGKEKDIFSREMRKALIAERKAVIHEVFCCWQEKTLKNLVKTLDIVCTICYNKNVKRTRQGESPRLRKERSVTSQ